MAIKDNNLVEKRNVLNEIRKNSMTLQEMRFFSIYLSKINARDIETRRVRFPLEDFRKIMELGRMNISHFQNVTNSLLGKVINIPDGRGGYEAFQLFKRCKVYRDDFEQWYVEIDAHDDALPLMFDFKKEYFTYELWNALRLKSGNQLRMYEILKQYEKLGERKISLPELKQLLGIKADEYPRWDNFRARVLLSCQTALAENTDICFTFEPIKIGKKITGVHFIIKKNTDYMDQLTLEDFIDMQEVKDDAPDIIEAEYFVEELKEEDISPESQYEDKETAFLASACDYEFSEPEMKELIGILTNKDLPADCCEPYDISMYRFHFLRDAYATLGVASSRGLIKTTRYHYFKGILQRKE